MKKYILLDFDGVMIPSKPWKPVPLMGDGFYEFNTSAIYNLNQIVKETGAEIILITSHKTSYPNSEWIKMFESRNILGSVSRLSDDNSGFRQNQMVSCILDTPNQSVLTLDWLKSIMFLVI